MHETVVDEETLTLTITGRTGSWLVSGVLGQEDLPLRGMDDRALAEMLRAMLPAHPEAGGPGPRPATPPPAPGALRWRGRRRRAG